MKSCLPNIQIFSAQVKARTGGIFRADQQWLWAQQDPWG